MNTPKCPACGRVMTRYGHSASGAQRWRCSLCNISQVSRINSTAKHLDEFLAWLLSRRRQVDLPGGAARFVGVVSRVYTTSADDQMKSYRDGSWGNHTQARNAVFTGTRQTRPTKKATFPRDKAEKSPFQQHDMSILIVGPNQLKYRLSRTTKAKSHPSSNTQCPITPIFRATSPQPTTTPLPRAITAQSTRS